MSQNKRYYSPTAVDFFRCFTLVDSQGESLFELTPRFHSKGNRIVNHNKRKKNPMLDKNSPERKARVEELRLLYLIMEQNEESPFDE